MLIVTGCKSDINSVNLKNKNIEDKFNDMKVDKALRFKELIRGKPISIFYSVNVINDYVTYKDLKGDLNIYNIKRNINYNLNKYISNMDSTFNIFYIDDEHIYISKMIDDFSTLQITKQGIYSNNKKEYKIDLKGGECIQVEYYNGYIYCFISGYDNNRAVILKIKEGRIQDIILLNEDYSISESPMPLIIWNNKLYVKLDAKTVYELVDNKLIYEDSLRFYDDICYKVEDNNITIFDKDRNIIKEIKLPVDGGDTVSEIFLIDKNENLTALGDLESIYIFTQNDNYEVLNLETVHMNIGKFIGDNFFMYAKGKTLNLFDLTTKENREIFHLEEPISYLDVFDIDENTFNVLIIGGGVGGGGLYIYQLKKAKKDLIGFLFSFNLISIQILP